MKNRVFDIIKFSVNNIGKVAAANLMTIWNRGFIFKNLDLSGIRAPKSDLSGGKFVEVLLRKADLN